MNAPDLLVRRASLAAATCMSAMLAACGMWDDSSPPVVTPPPVVVVQNIKGVAATGAAVAGATVTAKCATGGGTGTTATDGSYTVALSAGSAPPCLLEVATPAGDKLHSMVTSIDAVTNTAAANITPLTELVTAEVLGAVPTTVFANTDSAALASTMTAAITATKVSSASDKMVAMTVAGIKANDPASTLTAADLANPLGATLTAANGSTAGNVYDKALDTLATNLSNSGSTFADLVESTANSSTTAPPPATPIAPAPAPKASLPADLAQLPAAANCASLRSTVYRVVAPHYSGGLDEQTLRFQVDAKALTITELASGSTAALVPNGECRYLTNLDPAVGSLNDLVVSPAGVLVARTMTAGAYRLAIGLPEQTHTVAELAGNWNMVGREWVSGSTDQDLVYTGAQGDVSVSAAGAVSNITYCNPFTNCAAVTGKTITIAAITGGFSKGSTTQGEVWTDRLYVYKAGSGEMMAVQYSDNGSFSLWTKKADTAVSPVDNVTSTWGLWSGINGVSSGLVSDSHYITQTSDATAGSWVRNSSTDGHTETLTVNSPRSGYLHRAAGSSANNGGGTSTFGEFTGLGLRGMGVTGLWMPALNTTGGFFISVGRSNALNLPKLPAAMAGRPYAPTCAALRSGTYRMVQPRMSPVSSFTGTLTVNANAMTWTNSAGSSGTLTPSTTESCRFSGLANGATNASELVVSQAGVLVARGYDSGSGSYHLMMGFPEQTNHAVAELAGDWNAVGLELNATGSGYNAILATATLDATGKPTTVIWCTDEASRSIAGTACQTLTPTVEAWAADVAGGFSRSNGSRMFMYTSGTGTMAMQSDPDGSFKLWTPKRALTGIGNPLNRTWTISNDSSMSSGTAANGVSQSSFTNTKFDPATGELTRENNDDGHTETLTLNNPRDGFVHRATGTATTTKATATTPVGTVLNLREFTNVNMRGTMGINALWVPMLDFTPGLGRFQIAVSMP